MNTDRSKEMKLSELASHTGFPPRTIRLYITRGLLAGPLRRGRGAVYGEEHVQRLTRIKELQNQGLTLNEVAHALGIGTAAALAQPRACWQFSVAKEVTVTVQADVPPWRMRQIRNALAHLAKELSHSKQEEDHDHDPTD